MTASRLLRPARLILAAAVIVTGCAGTGGNKAGGPTTLVVLRMASADGEAGYNPGVDDLLNRVDALSNGNLRIEMALGVGGFKPDAEQQVVHGVADGTYDLGVVGTRVFDTMGVNSFRALTAPMLIDSYGLEGAVIASDIPTSMLRSLDQLHVAGLGIMGGGLEKPVGTVKALLGPNDWRGIGFGVNRSGAIASAIDALAAKPREVSGPERDQALKEATIQGFEMNMFTYRRLDLVREAPYVTSNVNLWPQTLAVIGRPDRLASLSADQRGWLTQAIQETSAGSSDLMNTDAALIPQLCHDGARFADASNADINALQDALAPVNADLRQDAETSEFIARIEQLKQQVSTVAVVIPDGCTGQAPANASRPSSQPSKTTSVTALDGTWEVTFTAKEFAAAPGVDPSEIGPEAQGTFALTFDRGDIRGPLKDGEKAPEGLTYVVQGDTLIIHASDASMGGQVPSEGPGIWTYRWSIYQDTLTFQKVSGDEPGCFTGKCEPSVFVVKPWHRIR